AEIWPDARHQLCVFHLLRDVLNKVLDAVRRLRRAQARRGRAGRKRRRGRPGWRHPSRRRRRGPTAKEKAAFARKQRLPIGQPAEQQTRSNNHVERLNRRLRFAEKVRYRWRKRPWVVRWVVLLLDVWWQERAAAATTQPKGERSPPRKSGAEHRKVA